MLAFVIAVSIVWHAPQRITFHHVSHERFTDHDECMANGRQAVRSMIRQAQHYRKHPPLRIKLGCSEQVTFES